MHPVIRDAALGDKAKVIKIDVDKNQLKGCVGLPLMIYKAGQMIWRQSGELDEYSLVLYKSNYNT
jgi:thioredoxin 1